MNEKEFLRLSKEKQIEIMSEHDLESMDFKGLFETAKDKIKEDYTNATDTEYSDYVSDYLDLCCDEDEKEYVVFVGGVKMTEHLIDKQEAHAIKRQYEIEGYNDVVIEEDCN